MVHELLLSFDACDDCGRIQEEKMVDEKHAPPTEIRCHNIDLIFIGVEKAQHPKNAGNHPAQICQEIVVHAFKKYEEGVD